MPSPSPIVWLREHPRAADALLAIALTTLALGFHLSEVGDAEQREPSWWTVVLVIGAVLPIAWRRTHTVASGLVVVGFELVATFLDITGGGFIGVTFALYAMGAHSSGPARRNAVIAISAAITLLFVAGLLVDELDIGGFISSSIVLVTAFVLGDNLRRRREKADSLIERAERAEREQELIAHQRVAAERTRIARELHDVVAHSVSVMVIQAAAARRSLDTDPGGAREALNAIEDTGRQTMNELRSILGVLRHGSDRNDLLPQPALTDLAQLVDANDDLPISLQVDGPVDSLPHVVTLTGYRVVQEALTNIRRHGGRVDNVQIRVNRSDHRLDIDIVDDGRGAAADRAEPGYGIIGMRERVAAVGGQLTAAPRRSGGWRVHALIPCTPLAAGLGTPSEVRDDDHISVTPPADDSTVIP